MGERRKAVLAAVCAFIVVSTGQSATAAETPTRAPVIQAVLNCRAIKDDAQRLACFDKAVGTVDKAEQTGDLVTLDRAQRRTVRRQAFGLSLPSLAMFDKGEKPDEADRIAVKLAQAHLDAQGKWIVKLDDGAVWRQTDDNELLSAPHPGSTAEIRKGVLGAFFMKIDGQSAIRVHRDS